MPKSKSPKTSARRVLASKVVSSGKRVWIYVDEWGEINEHYENYIGEPTESDKKDAGDFLRSVLAQAYSDAQLQSEAPRRRMLLQKHGRWQEVFPEKKAHRQPIVLLRMDTAIQAAWVAAVHDVDEGQLITEADIQAAWAAPVRTQIDAARLTAVMARFAWQGEAVRGSPLPPTMSLWQFSTEILGFSSRQLRLKATYTEWLSRYGEYISKLLRKAVCRIDGERVREARGDLELKVFARLLGISHDTLERIERNDRVSKKIEARVIRLCKKHRSVDVTKS